jgi:hypothetical protein
MSERQPDGGSPSRGKSEQVLPFSLSYFYLFSQVDLLDLALHLKSDSRNSWQLELMHRCVFLTTPNGLLDSTP